MPDVVLTLTAENFEQVSSGTWLVDFWSSWCAPCRAMEPILEELAREMPEVKIGKVEVDTNAELANRFNVTSLPTLFILRDGESIRKLIGVRTKRNLAQAMNHAGGGDPL